MSTETTIADSTAHRVVSAWKGEEPGSCGFECACGATFDGFDSITEAEACHRSLDAWVEAPPADMPDKPEPDEYEPAPSAPDPRVEYVAGLRMLADLLEAHPELNMPSTGSWSSEPIGIAEFGQGQRERIAAWARLLPGKKSKELGGTAGEILRMLGRLRGLHIKVICDRDEVCERRVLGIREVTEEVPDPEALAAVPKVAVTKTVEDVEWVCRPLLADGSSEVAA